MSQSITEVQENITLDENGRRINPVTLKAISCPTKYTPELIDKAVHYINNYREYGKNVPSIVRLAQVLEISRDRLYKWAQQDDKPEIKYILAKVNELQETELIENGLDSSFNSNITKLMLGKHGYHDKQEVTGTITVSKIERNIIDVTPQTEVIEHDPKSLIE